MDYWLLAILPLTALSGLLIHSLVLRLVLQRILPAQKNRIANAAGQFAAREFKAFANLEEKINDPRNLESILPMIESHIDNFLNEKLKKEMPMISMFIGSKTTDKLKEVFMKEIQELFPQVIGKFASNLTTGLNIEATIADRINSITVDQVSRFARENLAAELNWFRWLGAFTGFISGLLALLVAVLTA